MTSEPPATPPVTSRVAELFAADAASAALGIEVLEAAQGRARLRMTVRPDMVQGHATCHGGLLFTLADSAFAAACNQGPGGPVVGASAEITWVSAAFTGDVLEAEAVQHARYGRNGVTDVTVRRVVDGQVDGEVDGEVEGMVVALFRGRSLELRHTPGTGTSERVEA